MTDNTDLPPELLERVQAIIEDIAPACVDCSDHVVSNRKSAMERFLRAVAPMLIAHGRKLEKAEVAKRFDHIRSDLNNISRAIEDEGDRCYFGSTNDPDELRRVACDFEDWLLREERNEHKSNEHRRKP